MNLWYVTRRRGELLIAIVRQLLFVFALLWIEHPSRVVPALLGAGALAALAILVALRLPYFRSSWRTALQVFDVVLFAAVIHIAPMDDVATIAATLFLLFAAMIRFEWDGTLASGLAAACIVSWRRAVDPAAILSRDILVVSLVLSATLAATLFARYLRRKRIDVALIFARSSWPRTLHMLLREQLENAAIAMRSPRVAYFWREPAGRCEVALWLHDDFKTFSAPVDSVALLTPAALEGLDFFTTDAMTSRGLYSAFGPVEINEPAIDRRLLEVLNGRALLVARTETPAASGALIFLDRNFDSDDLLLARLAAEVIGNRLDLFWNSMRRERVAAAEERARIARDLHDGILQSLGGVSMQLEAVGKLITTDPLGAREVVRKIQDILSVDQHEIRSIVDGMRMETPGRQLDLRSGTRFSALAALVRMQWGADLDLRLDSLDGKIEKGKRREIHRLVREAVVNAAKHSEARNIVVEGGYENDSVRIVVKDDGHGFPFFGRFELRDLIASQQGPTSLKERVSNLGGNLVIDSRRNGSTVEITVPAGAVA